MKHSYNRLFLSVLLSLFGWWAGSMTVIATTPHPSSPEEGITTGDGTKHYLAFASDRHQNMSQVDSNTPVVSTAMSCWSDLPVEYVSLIGDMVGQTKGDAPAYDVKTVWDEVNAVFPSLSVNQFSIIWADHDGGYTDPSGLGVMKVPSTSTTDYGNKSTQIYTDPEHSYYIYAVNYYEMLNNTSAEPEAFKEWVDGIDKSALIIVLCHAPMHYLRKDNLNGAEWCDALNYAATGSVTGADVTRNVVFFHGHNHTNENMEYYYEPGQTVNMQGSGGSVSKTIRFTYITAGYMKKPSGANTVNATLLTMDDDEITFTKSKSGTTSILGAVERVSGEDVTYYTVTFETNGGTAVASQRVKEGRTATEPATPSMSGYTFDGWYADATLTTPYDFTTPITADLTLYAKWTEREVEAHTFFYSSKATEGEAYLIVSNGYALVNNNGKIDAVAVTADGNNVVIDDESVDESAILWTVGSDGSLKNGSYYVYRASGNAQASLTLNTNTSTKYSNWTYTGEQLTVVGGSGSSTTYYIYYNNGWYTNTSTSYTAKLYSTQEYHTVTFETNGGTAVEPQEVKDGDLLGPIGETTREGYTFAGWYKDEALTTEYNFLYPVKSDFTLYAKWTAIVYHTVTFNTNGGTAVASQKLEDGNCATEPTAPTLNGFTFAGWYSDEALTTEYDFTKPVTSDITIYAKWVAVTEACASPNLSYQNGKIVCTCATEGVTYQYTVALSNTEGTCTDGIITIGPTVTVTVRATREGMLDSAPTAIQFNLPAVGDVNGDGDITIADVTALVNAILAN